MAVEERTVVLRAFRGADEPGLHALFTDAQTRLWNPGPEPADIEEWWVRQNVAGPDGLTWAVADPTDDRLLGVVSVFDVDLVQGTAEVGYRVLPAERGRGVASAGLSLGARRAFGELGIRRIELFHAVENTASCGVARRAGFALEGTLRQSYVYGDGIARDEHLHARLRDD